MDWLIYFVIFLGIVTLVGHGVWVFLAFVVRTLFGEPPAADARAARCPNCERPMAAAQHECRHCGYRPASLKKNELDDLEAVERQLQRWRKRGELRPRLADRFTARIQAYRRELLRPRGATAPADQKIAATAAEPVHATTRLSPRRQETAAAAESPLEAIVVESPPDQPFAGLAAAALPAVRTPPAAPPVAPPPVAPPPAAPAAPIASRPKLPPPAPRRTLAEMLSAFMEQRNIRWGELVGGLLIVCSSIALVISLWDTLKTIPYFQFLIFVSVSAALFGVGLYTEHRWKLESTSRGILIIATLLVPLDFVAMAGAARPGWDWLAIVLEIFSLAAFTGLVERAARVLTPGWSWATTLAVVGNSGLLLFARRQPQAGWLAALAAVAVVLHGSAVARAVFSLRKLVSQPAIDGLEGRAPSPVELPGEGARPSIAERPPQSAAFGAERAGELFVLLGVSSFALVAALGLFVARGADRGLALNWISPLVALGALPVCAAGMAIVRGLKDEAALAGYRTAGMAVAIVGAVAMLAANALAWPAPAAIAAVGVLNFTALSLVAWRYRLPGAHAAAIASLAAVYLTGVHGALGHFAGVSRELLSRRLFALLFEEQTGALLVGLFAVLAIVSEIFARRRQAVDAAFYAGGSVVTAAASLSILAIHAYWSEDSSRWFVFGACSVYGTASLLCNLRWRRPELSSLGSALWAAGLIDAGILRPAVELACPWMTVSLVHATLTLALGLALSRLARRGAANFESAFTQPLVRSAAIASAASLASLLNLAAQPMLPLAGHLSWLAALWLALAIHWRSTAWFAGFQTVLAAAVLAAVTAWLYRQPWVDFRPEALLDPRSLQAYGIGLSLLCAGWSAARIALRRLPAAAIFVDNPQAAVDRWTFYLLSIGSLALAAWSVLPGVMAEIFSSQMAAALGRRVAVAFGPFAWTLVAAQGLALLTSLWDRWRVKETACGVLLCVTAAALAAGPGGGSLATASALRWSLSLAFLLGSAAVWFRAALARAAAALRCRCDSHAGGPFVAQALLLALCAAPVLLMTGAVVALRLAGNAPAGPLAGSWFDAIGFEASYLIPLAIVAATLLGYAVREVSPGYAFAAGAVTNLAVAGGYALSVRQFGVAEAVTLLELATIAAGLWAVSWLAIRGKILARSGRAESAAARPLLRLQLSLAALGNLLVILPAVGLLAVFSPSLFAEARSWITAAGSPLGWAALVSAVGAGGLAGWQQRRRWRPEVVGLLGMAALGLGACSIAWAGAGGVWAYRALMLGWALYSLSIVAATWWATAVYASETNASLVESLTRSAALWVRLAGFLALALGLKTAVFVSEEQLWAAGAIAVASAACATMAVWRRQEGWAFVAGLGVNLASTIVVWHWQFADRFVFADAWLLLVQANLIAAAAVALLWLAAHQRMYGDRLLSISAGPLLGLQISLVALGNLLALGAPLAELAIEPGRVAASLVQAGGRGGWLAWLLGGAAIAMYCQKVARRELPHVVTALMLGLGVLAAGAAAATGAAPWTPYHVLLAAWAAGGFVLLAIVWLAAPRIAGLSSLTRAEAILASISTLEFLVAALSLRGAWDDPARPFWSIGATASAGLLAAIAAVGFRKPDHKYASGVLVNLAVVWASIAAGRGWKVDFWLLHLAALGAQAVVWSLLTRLLDRRQAAGRGELPPFEHAAAAISAILVCWTVAYNVLRAADWIPSAIAAAMPFDLAMTLDAGPERLVTALAWIAWGAAAAAILSLVRDPRAVYRWQGLYAIGLAGAALAVERTAAHPLQLAQALAVAVSGYLLLATSLERFAGRLKLLPRALEQPTDNASSASSWFSPTQFALMLAAAVLSLWVVLHPSLPLDRLPGGAAAAMLLGLALLEATRPQPAQGAAWRFAALTLVAMTAAEAGWIALVGEGKIFWLHREIVLASALFLTALVCQFALPKVWPRASDWLESARVASIGCGGLLLALLAGVLLQEWNWHVPGEGVAMAPLAVAAVAAMLTGLTGLAIVYAVLPERDPLRLSLRDRTLYVYAAELLGLLIVVHIRTTVPRLLPIGMVERYWTLIVMLVAFAGAGLAELFRRRRLDVLSGPLSRTALVAPLIPALGHWLRPALDIDAEAVLLLVSAFYGVQATLRRSLGLAALAAVSGNAALWLLWHRLGIDFLRHPQLWLIPLALAALIAEAFNRDRLGPQQAGAVRYLALAVIYVSSTVDVFIARLSLPLALVLMGLSVAGVLAGILLRVRSFLYLGVSFLLVDLSLMIYHAAFDRGHMWVFWLSGIAAGAAILLLFAIFEKRRNDVQLAMNRFRQWS